MLQKDFTVFARGLEHRETDFQSRHAPGAAVARRSAEQDGIIELVDDLARYDGCVEDERKPEIEAWHDYAQINFAALSHDTIADRERAEVARGCAKADTAIKAALARCAASP